MLDFLNISCAANFFLDNFGAPYFFAAGSAWALDFHFFAAAWFVNTAACARIVFPGTWITNAFFYNRTGNVLGHCFPFATANINILCFCNWLADSVAVVTVASFRFSFVGCAANVFVACLINRFADSVAAVTVACLVNGLAGGVAAFPVACFVNWLAGCVGAVTVACFVDWFAGCVSAISVTCFVNRFAYGVTFIPVAGFCYVFVTLYGNFFANCIVYSFAAGVIFFHPYSLFDCFVTGFATLLCCTILATGLT